MTLISCPAACSAVIVEKEKPSLSRVTPEREIGVVAAQLLRQHGLRRGVSIGVREKLLRLTEVMFGQKPVLYISVRPQEIVPAF